MLRDSATAARVTARASRVNTGRPAAPPNRLSRIARREARLFSYTDPKSSAITIRRDRRRSRGVLNADFSTRVYFHGTNLRSRGPPPACTNSDTDFPGGLSRLIRRVLSLFIFLLLSYGFHVCDCAGEWLFCGNAGEDNGPSRGALAPSRKRSIPRLAHMELRPLVIL